MLPPDLERIMLEFSKIYRYLSAEERKSLIVCLTNITEIIVLDATEFSLGKPSKLALLTNYTSKALKQYQSSGGNSDLQSLRSLRNRLVHGGSGVTSSVELRRYATSLWRALERSANDLDPGELFNLLAYSMGTVRTDLDPQTSNTLQIIRAYKIVFISLDEHKKKNAFKELLLRLYSDPRFRRILEESEKY